jgi:hypothetical protein
VKSFDSLVKKKTWDRLMVSDMFCGLDRKTKKRSTIFQHTVFF